VKKTTVQWFCDKCGAEMAERPPRGYCAGRQQDYSGSVLKQFRVLIEYQEYRGVECEQSMLCDKCKVEALEEVLKKLKAKKEQSK
jgi:hypothetical protein